MKTIKYKGIEFKYKIDSDGYTQFFFGETLKYQFNFLGMGFGKIKMVPNLVFIVDINIEDAWYSEKDVRLKIKSKFKTWKRELKIKSGKII